MDQNVFDKLIQEQIDTSMSVLVAKGKAYAPGRDKLHNFRIAAELDSSTLEQALGGMMKKHTVKLYDMIHYSGDVEFSPEEWEEVITDHVNYLLILSVMVRYASGIPLLPEDAPDHTRLKEEPFPDTHVPMGPSKSSSEFLASTSADLGTAIRQALADGTVDPSMRNFFSYLENALHTVVATNPKDR